MMKKVSITKYILFVTLALTLLVATSITVFADEAGSEAEIPTEGVTYTLTYPDGSVITENESGEPLTYDDVTRLMKEENWKLLASGLVSDENGEAALPATWEKGTIKIIETKVPEGYTQGEVSEVIAELENGTATLINPKIKDPEPSVEPKPSDPVEPSKPSVDPTPTTPAEPTEPVAAKTGDSNDILPWIGILMLAALITGVVAINKYK